MGVLNVTPDSFSDGGRYLDAAAALAHGRQLAEEGADLLDVGGESSRPGARPVEEAEELRRVLPVIEGLRETVPLSIDTTKAAVARAAVGAGATLINDISGTLWPVAAELGVGWVSMHMRGTPGDMQQHADYDDVVAEVRRVTVARARQALDAGVPQVWLDPGIGFAKTARHNMAILGSLGQLVGDAEAIGAGVLVGTSRKAFLAAFGSGATPSAPGDRLEASLATAVWSMASGVGMVRVHDVGPTVQAAALVARAPGVSP